MVLKMVSQNAMSVEYDATGKRSAGSVSGSSKGTKRAKKSSKDVATSALVALASSEVVQPRSATDAPIYTEESTLTMKPTVEIVQKQASRKVAVAESDVSVCVIYLPECKGPPSSCIFGTFFRQSCILP